VTPKDSQLHTFYFADDPTRRAAAKLLARDEAKQIAENIARLPGLLPKQSANEQ